MARLKHEVFSLVCVRGWEKCAMSDWQKVARRVAENDPKLEELVLTGMHLLAMLFAS